VSFLQVSGCFGICDKLLWDLNSYCRSQLRLVPSLGSHEKGKKREGSKLAPFKLVPCNQNPKGIPQNNANIHQSMELLQPSKRSFFPFSSSPLPPFLPESDTSGWVPINFTSQCWIPRSLYNIHTTYLSVQVDNSYNTENAQKENYPGCVFFRNWKIFVRDYYTENLIA